MAQPENTHPTAELLTHECFAADGKTVRFNIAHDIIDVKDVFRTFLAEQQTRQHMWRHVPTKQFPLHYIKWNGEGHQRRVLPIRTVILALTKMSSPEAHRTAAVLQSLVVTTLATSAGAADAAEEEAIPSASAPKDSIVSWIPPPAEVMRIKMVTDPVHYGTIWGAAQQMRDEGVKKRCLHEMIGATERTNQCGARTAEMQTTTAELEEEERRKDMKVQGDIRRVRMKYDFLIGLGKTELADKLLAEI